jgi:hypothetical protein
LEVVVLAEVDPVLHLVEVDQLVLVQYVLYGRVIPDSFQVLV